MSGALADDVSRVVVFEPGAFDAPTSRSAGGMREERGWRIRAGGQRRRESSEKCTDDEMRKVGEKYGETYL